MCNPFCCPARFTRWDRSALSARARNDRGRPGGCDCDRFQSRFVADFLDADGAVACLHQMKMSPAEAITAATINAAYSLGRGDNIGSLEPGKLANFSIFDCEDYRELAYWFGSPQMHSVYVRGENVWRMLIAQSALAANESGPE